MAHQHDIEAEREIEREHMRQYWEGILTGMVIVAIIVGGFALFGPAA